MAVAAILFLLDSSQILIRLSEIPIEQSYKNLNAIQATVHKLSCPQAF